MSKDSKRHDEKKVQCVSENKRTFLKLSAAAVTALALNHTTASNVSANNTFGSLPVGVRQTGPIDLGSGDVGILNYAYALEQLEAAFYTRVADSFYTGVTAEEQQILRDIRDHENIHREFFRAALGPNAIPTLTFNFDSVDFSNRESVLVTAQILEDTGVAAYNGAGQLIENTDYLVLAGKIVSVEARHAATIRDLRLPGTGFFAPDPADPALDPPTVLAKASPFIQTPVSAANLPKITAV